MGLIAETFVGAALRFARHIQWLTVNPEEHRQAGELGLVLPFPPSANALWRPVIRDGKGHLIKSNEYEGWIIEAGYKPLAGRWCRLREGKNKIAWGMVAVAVGLHYGRDASNVFKAAEDLVCAMTGLEDRYNRTPTTLRLDLTRELRKEGFSEGLYVLVEELEGER